MRAVNDRKGELFALLDGDRLLSLDGELSGSVDHRFVYDLSGTPRWRVIGDGIYELDGFTTVGYFGSEFHD